MLKTDGMEETINALLAQDAAAQEKLRGHQQLRQKMADTMAQAKEDMQKGNLEKANKRIEGIRRQHEEEFDEEARKLTASYEAALASLRETYEANRAQWIDSLAARCLK